MIGILLAAVLWGTTGTAATLLPDAVSPLATGAATMAVGGLLLALTAPRGALLALRTRGAPRWLLPGALAVAVYPLAFYSGMSLAGVAIGNVVALGTAPVFAAVLEQLLDPADRRQPLGSRWLLSAVAATAGVALLAVFGHHGGGAGTADGTVPGVALGLLAGLAYAGYTYTAGRAIGLGVPSRGAMAAQFGLGAVLLLPVLLATGGSLLRPGAGGADSPLAQLLGAPHPLVVVGYLAVGPMFLAYVLFGRGLRTVSSSRATTVTLLEPLVATLLAVVAVGERLAAPGWLGLALVLAGVVSVATERRAAPGGTAAAPAR
ncbi:DMT family transporter [Arenivirga flava]|uniref:Permease n=1 Tax=Arenivirga flava TaxID=1930060 RepID=A0AA37UH01_9MICO|nr:EamA family transporter [Arenivirga flava]GMA27896.1 permease [Arenivirga flava]